ncbi:MAG: BatA and WFA domain-containing protein [Phycisphaerales bacterium]
MNWLTPGLAGLAAAVAVPSLLILYFLKLRRRDVEVSSTFLWKKSIQDMQANAPFQRLRKNILLLLQLIALALGIAAIGQPTVEGTSATAERIVFVIDRSASMSALDGPEGTSRLDRAKADALAYIDAMSDGTILSDTDAQEAMVIVFDASAEVLLPYTSNKSRLRAAIRSVEPTDAPSNISQAMRLARANVDMFREGIGMVPGAPIIVWSDGRVDGTDDVQLHPQTQVEYRRVGEPDAANVSITSMRVERAFDDPEKATVFVAMQNNAPNDREVLVEFGVNGAIQAARARTLPGIGEDGRPVPAGVVFEFNRSQQAILSATIAVDDALAADNTARVFLPSAEQLSVGLVTEGNLFLSTAFEGMPVRLRTMTPEAYEQIRADARLDEFDVFVMDGWMPVLERADAGDGPSLPPGRYLIFGQVPTMRGLTPGEAGRIEEAAIVTDFRRDHPALRLSAIESIVIGASLSIDATSEVNVLAETTHGPGIVEAADGPVKAIVVAFDATESSWPFDPGFILFLANAVEYLGSDGGDFTQEDITPGGTLTTRLPVDARDVKVVTPDGQRFTVNPSSDGRISYGPIPTAGLYEVTWEGPPGPRDPVIDGRPHRPIPVNLFDPEESSLRVEENLALVTGVTSTSNANAGSAGDERLPLRHWALLGLLGMLMLEWYIYNRKVHL